MVGWIISDYAYALGWQARAVFSRTAPDSFLGGSQTPIVVVPGVYETWKFMQPLAEELNRRGHPVHVIDKLSWNTLPVSSAAQRVADYLDEHGLRNVVILAHSKGGLIGKYLMTVTDHSERVASMLAVATPFGGSRWARLMLVPSLRIFSPFDPTILALTGNSAVNTRIVSIYSQFDLHVPDGSYLAGAKNVTIDTGGHFRILSNPRVIAELAELSA